MCSGGRGYGGRLGGGKAHRGQNRAGAVSRGPEIHVEKDKLKHEDIQRDRLVRASCGNPVGTPLIPESFFSVSLLNKLLSLY